MRACPPTYTLLDTPLGCVGIVWKTCSLRLKVQRVVLSTATGEVEQVLRRSYPNVEPSPRSAILDLCNGISAFLDGKAVSFALEDLDLDSCSAFQRSALLAEYGVPRGCVTTYGRLARHIGVPGAARAVGSALARNPFPLLIPCHRAIRSDGMVGGFQAGSDAKRRLLQLEGIRVSASGHVEKPTFHY